jgi:restriction system protein
MAMPTYEEAMLPFLLSLADGKEHQLRAIYCALATTFALSDEELQQTTSSGKSKLFYNRVGWAQTYLKKAGLIASARKGHYTITSRGRDVLKSNPDKITNKMLMQYPEFVQFWGPTAKSSADGEVDAVNTSPDYQKTPQELMDDCHWTIRRALADELLQQISGQPPGFFERLVLDLLVRMGYGGSREDAAQVVGKSGDEGIDGIIKEDRLGLDVIYVQAKRWKNNVGSPEIQGFIGALQLKGAHKGIFITTSTFTQAARDVAAKVGNRIVLIDGMQLAQLMIDYNVGVSTETAYEVKKIDSDYFDEQV